MKKILLFAIFMTFFAKPIYGAESDRYNSWKENYDHIFEMTNDKTYVCKKDVDNKSFYYVTDTDGNIIFQSDDYIIATDDFDRYIVCVDNENEKYDKITDGHGNTLNDKKYSTVRKINGKNLYVAEQEERILGIIDDKGNTILPFFECDYISNTAYESEYDGFSEFRDFKYFKYFKYESEYDGFLEFKDFKYENKYNGFLEFRDFKNNISGFIDINDMSKIIVDIPSDNVHIIDKNTIYSEKSDNNKSIFKKYENGKFIDYKVTDWTLVMYEGERAIIKDYKNVKFGIADKELNVICEPKYDKICFLNGYFVVHHYQGDPNALNTTYVFDDSYGIIDKNGNEVVKCEYNKIICEGDSFICIKDKKKNIVSFDKKLPEPKCSDWAKESIIYADLYGIIPEEINGEFSKKITREEFCKLAVNTFLKSEGCNDIESYIPYCDNIKNYFDDTDSKYVVLANYKGIVSGKGNGKFCPNDTITRQEAAVMLANLLRALRCDMDTAKSDFVDDEYFAEWAKESIYKVTNFKDENGISVMAGTGNGKFSPWYSYDREQAIATMVRIYDIANHMLISDFDYDNRKYSQ